MRSLITVYRSHILYFTSYFCTDPYWFETLTFISKTEKNVIVIHFRLLYFFVSLLKPISTYFYYTWDGRGEGSGRGSVRRFCTQ